MNTDKNDLIKALDALDADFLKGGYYNRLVFSRGILDMRPIRELGKSGANDGFYRGVTLPPSLSSQVDEIVATYGAFPFDYKTIDSHRFEYCEKQEALLVILSRSGMGFYIAEERESSYANYLARKAPPSPEKLTALAERYGKQMHSKA